MSNHKNTLLLSAKTLKLTSVIELNTDEKVLSTSIFDVQNTDLKAVLQPDLYNYILLQVYTNKTTGQPIQDDTKGLLDDYITPYLLNSTLCDFIFANQYKISNAGTEKLSGAGFQNVTSEELQNAINHYKAKKATYKKLLLDELKRRKLLSRNAEVDNQQNFGFFLDTEETSGTTSTFEDEGVIINDVVGIGFDEDTGDLDLITASANRITTNLDGRYRLSTKVQDIINADTTTLLQFNPTKCSGCFVDYIFKHDNNQMVGRLIANWANGEALATAYTAPIIGTMNITFDFEYVEDSVVFNVVSNVNDVSVILYVSQI